MFIFYSLSGDSYGGVYGHVAALIPKILNLLYSTPNKMVLRFNL